MPNTAQPSSQSLRSPRKVCKEVYVSNIRCERNDLLQHAHVEAGRKEHA